MLLMVAHGAALAQQPPNAGQQPPRVEERIEVVGVTPIHGIGLEKSKVHANVQVFTVEALRSPGLDVATLLAQQGAGVQVSEAQGGAFQPDVLFRGFAGSPLLGASEGLAVYQDGVRINDPFGDTVHWDMLPSSAIASINLIPGSNPLFGLNALGGALSIRTKSGFDFPRRRASLTAGSFGRRHIDAEAGAHGDSLAYYVAGGLTDETGWRDFSPSTIRRVFGDFAWRGLASAVNVGVTAASNDLIGNGAAPVELLDDDRDAVFTHPDRTENDGVLLTTKARRQTSDRVFVEGVAYYRHTRNGTFNGDAADGNAPGDDDQAFDAINNISHTRGRATGGAAQVTRTAPFLGRDNLLILGTGLDAAVTRFDFSTELAHLTADRGTTGAGVFDDDDAVDLRSRILVGGAFATTTWSLTGALAVTGGARFNWTSLRLRDQLGTALTGDHRFRRISPATGVTYRVRPWLDVYGSYAQPRACRPPSS
jgi:iron complex outermembrane receptor protein